MADDAEGGDPVCWLDRVCPGCGRLDDGARPEVCPACGTALADEPEGPA
jgi:rubrerythrin